MKIAESMIVTALDHGDSLQPWHDAKLRLKCVADDVHRSWSHMHHYETKRLNERIWNLEVLVIPVIEKVLAFFSASRFSLDELLPYYNWDGYSSKVISIEKEVCVLRKAYVRTRNNTTIDPVHLARKYEELSILFERLRVAPVVLWTSKHDFHDIHKSWKKSLQFRKEIAEYLRQIQA